MQGADDERDDNTEAAWDSAEEGAELVREGEYAKAVEWLTELTQREPRNEYAHFFLGCAYYEQELYAKALRPYLTAVEIAPRYVGALNHLGHTLRMLRRYDEAIRLGHQILAFEKDDPDALYLIGTSHFAAGNTEAAKQALERFLTTRAEPEVALEVEGMLQVLRGEIVDVSAHADVDPSDVN
jgi:tetratricopeptide (TPR) repeat protein